MDNLPIELVYEILAFSGHGTLRYGYIHYDAMVLLTMQFNLLNFLLQAHQ